MKLRRKKTRKNSRKLYNISKGTKNTNFEHLYISKDDLIKGDRKKCLMKMM
jgi:hypothetical protein